MYFYNIEFVHAIVHYEKPSEDELASYFLQQSSSEKQNECPVNSAKNDTLTKRVKASVNLVSALQELYVLLIGSDKKYIDPTKVINFIVDEQGCQLIIGD